jgi:hypothetical protein
VKKPKYAFGLPVVSRGPYLITVSGGVVSMTVHS